MVSPKNDHKEVSMEAIYYIGLDIHMKVIAYCIKTKEGRLVDQGKIGADRASLIEWVNGLPGPWIGAMEATIFTGWIYDFFAPFALDLKVAHPEMLKAITAAKKKNDRADADMITDLLRVNLMPQCHMLPEQIRELRRVLRYRNHVVRTAVKKQKKCPASSWRLGPTTARGAFMAKNKVLMKKSRFYLIGLSREKYVIFKNSD
jgi:hypothetical protein